MVTDMFDQFLIKAGNSSLSQQVPAGARHGTGNHTACSEVAEDPGSTDADNPINHRGVRQAGAEFPGNGQERTDTGLVCGKKDAVSPDDKE